VRLFVSGALHAAALRMRKLPGPNYLLSSFSHFGGMFSQGRAGFLWKML
jgi:hypothetical protein